MRYLLILSMIIQAALLSQELKIQAKSFKADENKGLSVFSGDVNIIKGNDELNASKVIIYTNKENKPTKFIADGNVSFVIETQQGSKYTGEANKVIFFPKKKEYHFFENVHLRQIDEKKEILGDKVVLKISDGKAYAEGIKKEPVIMIFDIADKEPK
ncbi:lipopolysaccharide transport periplasmic protein LptA [Sulfurimonas sp.]